MYDSYLFYVLHAFDSHRQEFVVLKFGTDENIELLDNELTTIFQLTYLGIDEYTHSIGKIIQTIHVSRDILTPLLINNRLIYIYDTPEKSLDVVIMPVYQPIIFTDIYNDSMKGFLFELLYTIAVCNMNGVFHGDLHSHNVLQLSVDYVRQYTINDRKYTIRNTFLPIIIDWSGPYGNRIYKYGTSDFQIFFSDIKNPPPELVLDVIGNKDPKQVILNSFFDVLLTEDVKPEDTIHRFERILI